MLSHQKAVEVADLIFEDDFILCADFDSRLNEVLSSVEYDMLFLNGTLGKFHKEQKENDFVYRVFEMYGAFGYLVSKEFKQTVINELEINKGELSTDAVYCKLMKTARIYRAIKPLVFHRRGWSDRTERIEKQYTHLEK